MSDRYRVIFKDEGEEGGVTIGPVWIIDTETDEAVNMGWRSLPEAMTIAKQHDAKLEMN